MCSAVGVICVSPNNTSLAIRSIARRVAVTTFAVEQFSCAATSAAVCVKQLKGAVCLFRICRSILRSIRNVLVFIMEQRVFYLTHRMTSLIFVYLRLFSFIFVFL